MIPVAHGKPCCELVPWVRLYPSPKGNGWVGRPTDGWWVYLFRNKFRGVVPGDYVLMMAGDREKPRTFARLNEEDDGGEVLVGRNGMGVVVVRKDSVTQGDKPRLTVYWGIKFDARDCYQD